ncbi:putative DNA primase/helicase [Spirosoma lacussanchae]|uniref:DNA primase family protein n=1 Tax=Spirosoma lacussanchae TaxID=1884249 RepID=UPI001108AECA|nr:phage/plasmid primase, P4 family [Spirosoma lacussanchae]
MQLAIKDNGIIDKNKNPIEALKEEVARHTQEKGEISHDEVLNSLLAQIELVDFRALAGLEPEEKVKRPHYLILAVEQVLEIASRNRWQLANRDGFFYIFNGRCWRPVDAAELRTFLRQAAERMGVEKFTARYVEFAKSLLDQFSEAARLPPPPSRPGVMINLRNGTLDINTRSVPKLRPPDPGDFLTYELPFDYDPTAQAPTFKRFLDRCLPDPDCQKILAEFFGYVFVRSSELKLEKALLLYGGGANGKSVIFEVLNALLGPDNVSQFGLTSLTNEPAYSRAHLVTMLLNYASEISGRLEADTFKQLVSGEPMEARLPYGQPFIIRNYAKLAFNCNVLPADVEHTNAFFRRLLILPFTVTIPENERDPMLASSIIATELPGVLNWVLDGLRRLLYQRGFTKSEQVDLQLSNYRKQSDSVLLFLEENGYRASQHNIALKLVYGEYRAFCSESGYRPVNAKNFRERAESVGILSKKSNIGQVLYTERS